MDFRARAEPLPCDSGCEGRLGGDLFSLAGHEYNADKTAPDRMATYTDQHREILRRAIRDIKAIDPLITYVDLADRLSKRFNRSYDREYVAKLSKKVDGELRNEVDRPQIEKRLSGIRENY